ncbi:MAG: amidohydrolase family protein [Treponemataceae bacterium]|nr:amidohydrolase family protein [Treponemataceae bacterium]
MTDWHVHIGQWYDTYYDAEGVFKELKSSGIDEVWFSSTTSCRYCKESFAVQNDESLQQTLLSACDLYELIRSEIKEAFVAAEKLDIKAHALYWVVPEIHFSKNSDVSVAQAMSEIPYEGFKIHPRAQSWDLQDCRTAVLAEEVFSYAKQHNKHILIHCGENDFELPVKFESYIASYPEVTVQLSHCRPVAETLYMLRKYPNTVCDTAFTLEETKLKIKTAGFQDRLRYGSDYPISKYGKS